MNLLWNHNNASIISHVMQLRWLEIVSWRARPGPLNTATESQPMHATIELQMEYLTHARCKRTRLAHAQIAILYPRNFGKI